MARIRTIKPEFWDSPSTAKARAVTRLAFIALWNWADDHGRGTANLKELEGFIFPNDDIKILSGGNAENFRDIVGEIREVFGVIFYEVDGRPYYEIPSWRDHQRNEKRAPNSKYPGPEERDQEPHDINDPSGKAGNVRDSRDTAAEPHGVPVTGTGEKGNMEQGNSKDSSSGSADAETRPEIISILEAIDQHCADHDFQKPNRTQANITAARLLLDKDGYTLEQILWIIQWITRDSFWTPNVRSASKLREKFEQIKAKATTTPTNTGRKSSAMAGLESVANWTTPDHLLLEN